MADGSREKWSLSAVARIEQNLERRGSGVTPGDDIVVDRGVGRMFRVGERAIDAGVSGSARGKSRRSRAARAQGMQIAITSWESDRKPTRCPRTGLRVVFAHSGSSPRTT